MVYKEWAGVIAPAIVLTSPSFALDGGGA